MCRWQGARCHGNKLSTSVIQLRFNPSEGQSFYLLGFTLCFLSFFLSFFHSLLWRVAPSFWSDFCAQVCPASSPVVPVGVVMLRRSYVASAAGTLPLHLASAIAPAWPDLRAPLITWVGVVAVETPTGVLGLHCTHAHAPHHSLNIEGWPEQPLSLWILIFI